MRSRKLFRLAVREERAVGTPPERGSQSLCWEKAPRGAFQAWPVSATDYHPVAFCCALLFIAVICVSARLSGSVNHLTRCRERGNGFNGCRTKDSNDEIKTQFLARKNLIHTIYSELDACLSQYSIAR